MSLVKNCHSSHPWQTYGQVAHYGRIGSGLLLIVTLVAFGVIFALNPPHHLSIPSNYPALTIVSAIGVIALGTFITSNVIRYEACRKCSAANETIEPHQSVEVIPLPPTPPSEPSDQDEQRAEEPIRDPPSQIPPKPSENDQQPLPPSQENRAPSEIIIEIQNPQPLEVPPLEKKVTAGEIKMLAPPMLKAFEDLIVAFVNAYQRSYHIKNDKETAELQTHIQKFNQLILNILDDKEQLVQFAIFYAFEAMVERDQLEISWTSTPEEFLKTFSHKISKTSPAGQEEIHKCLKEIVNRLEQKTLTSSEKDELKDKLQTANTCFKRYMKCKNQEKPNPEDLYNSEWYYDQSRQLLFKFLMDLVPRTEEEIDELYKTLIPEFLAYFQSHLFQTLLPNQIEKFLNGFEPTGIFPQNDDKIRKATWTVAKYGAKGRVAERPELRPLKQNYQKAFVEVIAMDLLPLMANPIYYATRDTSTPIYKASENLFKEMRSKPIPQGEMTWAAYFDAYTQYLKDFKDQFDLLFK